MGLTGIIYASIVVAWAAYLVPLALRRHDEAARSRSIHRFSSTMRVLSRQGAASVSRASAGRVVVTPPRPVDRVLSPGLQRTGSTALSVPPSPRPSREALRRAASRRRKVLAGLMCGTAIVGAAVFLGYLAVWSVGIPVAMLAMFLLLARYQVRRASDSYWAEAKLTAPAPSNVIRRGSTRIDASHGAAKLERSAKPAKSEDDEPTVPLDAERLRAQIAVLEQEHSVAVALPTADGGSLWDPLPILLPTYAEKSVARRTIRTIDLGAPLDGQGAAAAAQAAGRTGERRPTAADAADSEPALEPARVVNG